MSNESLIDKLIKLGVRTWLKSKTSKIQIKILDIVTDNKFKRKIKELNLEAIDLIYQNFYINKIIVNIYNCNLKFNYKNHLIYSDDLFINCSLIIDNRNLEYIFFEKKWKSLRIKIQDDFTEGNNVSNLVIENGLIYLNYENNNCEIKTFISLNLKDNLIFLENIKNNKKLYLPLDKNIKFKSCLIKNELINLDLFSKVIFDN